MKQLIKKLDQIINDAKENKTYNIIKVLEGKNDALVKINGKEYLNMCSNNYLGFAANDDSIQASIEGLKKYGVGSGAVRSISGSQSVHLELEDALAKFKGVDATIVVQSGFQANTGLIPAIVGKQDVVISDQLNHASIIDGVRLVGLPREQRFVYEHVNMQDLEAKLTLAKAFTDNSGGSIFVITDGVFSMDGDYAPLDKIDALCDKFDAIPIVDDAHGEGVFGNHGRGLVDHFGLQGKFIEIGTLSKAFGTAGGFIGGPQALIDFLKQKARPFLFSTGIDVAVSAATIHNVKVLVKDDSRVKKLWENTKYLKDGFKKLNISTGDSMSPITPVIVGQESKATKLTKLLFEDGILVSPIIFPTVPKGKGRIRIMPSALHTKDQLDRIITLVDKHLKTL